MTERKVLLSVLAHPDDESFGMGGTLAYYADQGVEVHLICATRGEVGQVAPEYLQDFPSIAELREAELCCAAAHLGLTRVHFLDYRDSGMLGSPENDHPQAFIQAPIDEVAELIATQIRVLKPQVVLTFDPIGGYRHPDHIHIHDATVKAFELAGDPDYMTEAPPFQPQKLFYHTISRRFLRLAVRMIRLTRKDPTKWGQNEDIDLTSLAVEDYPVHAKIRYPKVEKRKQAASACHASQGGGRLIRPPLSWILRWAAGSATDTFMQAFPEPEAGKVLDDLFQGI
jgi:LmbE family N-acetylglucosaminyl deacetylase